MNVSKTLLLAVLLSACSGQKTGRLPEDLRLGSFSNAQVNGLYQTLNAFRRELGLRPLRQDARLSEAARKHSDWMQGIGYLTHVGPAFGGSSFSRAMAEGVPSEARIGENIARGNFSGRETFLQWLYSPSHLGEMIDAEYDHVGIARSDCDEESWSGCFWTMDFGQFEEREESARLITRGEVVRAAEAVLGPLGNERSDITVTDPTE